MQLEHDFNNQRLAQLIQRAKIGSDAALTHIRMKEAITVMASICKPDEQGKYPLGTIVQGYEFLLTINFDALKTQEDLSVILMDFMDLYHAKKIMAEAALGMMTITLLRLHFKALVLPWITTTTQATRASNRRLSSDRQVMTAMTKDDLDQLTAEVSKTAIQSIATMVSTTKDLLIERLEKDLEELQNE